MKTVIAKDGFTAYPNGKRTYFPANAPLEVSNALAESLEKKGLVRVEAEDKGRGRKPAAEETGPAAVPNADPEPAATAD